LRFRTAACAIAVVASLPSGATAQPPGPDPARGMSYAGLERSGACGSGYRVAAQHERLWCTHGPDPAPPGVDVRHRATAAELTADVEQPGSDERAGPECHGDGVSGHRVQLLYVHASDVVDRHALVAPNIAQWAQEMDAAVRESAAQTGGVRSLRFAMPDCGLSVPSVTVSPAGDDDLAHTAQELADQGYDRADRDYVAFVDATRYCGIALYGMRYARVDSGCWGAGVALHELSHNLSAVSNSAPNASGGFHCTDEYDVMCTSDEPHHPAMRFVCGEEQAELLDCGHDDYFHTDPPVGSFLAANPALNLADSSFMAAEDGESATYLPPAPPGYRGPRYTVGLHNADDELSAYGISAPDGRQVRLFRVGYLREREADVTGALVALADGRRSARLRLVATNAGDEYSYGFRITRDGETTVLDERDGEPGEISAGAPESDPDPETGHTTFYDRTVSLSLNDAPVAAFALRPEAPVAGEPVRFESSSSDREGPVATHAWDLDGDGGFDDGSDRDVEFSYPAHGNRRVALRVTDGHGVAAEVARTFPVLARPAASFDVDPGWPAEGEEVTFTSTSSDPDGSIAAYEWDLDGDQTFDDATGPTAAARYPAYPDLVQVSVRVIDDDGLEAVGIRMVPIKRSYAAGSPREGDVDEPEPSPSGSPGASDPPGQPEPHRPENALVPPSPADPRPQAWGAPRLTLAIPARQTFRGVARRGLATVIAIDARCPCELRQALRLGPRLTVAGRAVRSPRAAGRLRVAVQVRRGGRARLAGLRRLRGRLDAKLTDAHGRSATARRRVDLRPTTGRGIRRAARGCGCRRGR
jgi:hypothetical protein